MKGSRRAWRYFKYHSKFKEYHWSDNITDARFITCKRVRLGRKIYIGPNCRIQGVTKYNDIPFYPEITLGDRVTIQQNCHISCGNKITIGENTAIAANVTITDIIHPYEDINIPVEFQNLQVKEVIIGPDSKIFNGAVILPGVHIGRHCVLGANSVLNIDMPDYSIAAGVPAKIIKRYDFDTNTWRRTHGDGNFVDE